MADITMCRGDMCPLKTICYRHTARSNPYRQAYFQTLPYNDEKEECEHYIDIAERLR